MRFAADAMLGKLAKWLRILGYDTTYKPDIDDDELVAHAGEEGRLILTRDTGLVRRLEPGRYLFINDNAPADQLAQAVRELGLDPAEDTILTRCTWCNTPTRRAAKDEVQGLVPEYTLSSVREFFVCPSCGRAYWSGTHRVRILGRLRSIEGRAASGKGKREK